MTRSPVEILSLCMGHAIHAGLSQIHYSKKNWVASRETGEDVTQPAVRDHSPEEAEVVGMFQQLWSSTALGFGGVGGAAMTNAYTVIIRSTMTAECLVYFDGRFAYRIARPTTQFFQDVREQTIKPTSESAVYDRR